MSTINTILDPAPDGMLHLPVPEAWRHLSIRVRAELEPVAVKAKPGAWRDLPKPFWMAPDFDTPLNDFKDYMDEAAPGQAYPALVSA